VPLISALYFGGAMKTPEILEPALRQYQHNDCSGFIAGFDHNETSKIVNIMEKALKAQSRLLVASAKAIGTA
jgi:hypothetical protein